MLEKVQEAEANALKHQRDAQSKQTALRKALQTIDMTREENTNLKKELATAKQNMSTDALDLQKMKREAERSKRELELANVWKAKNTKAIRSVK